MVLQKAVFLDRDGVINKECDFVTKPEELELLPYAADGIRLINQAGFLAIVVTNQSGIARQLFSIETLYRIHNKMRRQLAQKNAKIDAFYFCPHLPDPDIPNVKPEFNITCDCRKPKPGLLFRAQKEWNIDLKRSFLIGDSHRDILCGKSAGIATIVVKTGKPFDERSIEAQFICENLLEAAKTILEN